MGSLTDSIEGLVEAEVEARVVARTAQYRKALQEAAEILLALVGEPEYECDVCGEDFVPQSKTVKTRKAYCSTECADKGNSEEYEAIRRGKRKHTAMPPEVKNSPAGEVARSSSQQLRRAREAAEKQAYHECPNCGKPTAKLYCDNACRKEYEKDLKQPVEFSDPWQCARCRELGGLCDLHQRLEQDGKQPPLAFKY